MIEWHTKEVRFGIELDLDGNDSQVCHQYLTHHDPACNGKFS